MRSSFIAIVLCIFATAAGAECVAQAPVGGIGQAAGMAQVAARPGAQLAKATAARTHTEQALPADDGPPVARRAAPAAKGSDEHPRRGGSAMLLAAVALMTGIALRRYTTRMQ